MNREEAINYLKKVLGFSPTYDEAFYTLFPQLKESEDERIRKEIISFIEYEEARGNIPDVWHQAKRPVKWIDYLEKQKEHKLSIIPWTGKNLKEVIDFTGKSPKFDEWFKSWDEFEEYVHTHNDILKLFCEDGSHYEVPVGAWIVKTPDGYNIPSRFRFVQKPAEWGRQSIIDALTKWLTEKIAPLHKKSLDGTITEREEMFMAALLEIRSLVNSPDFQIWKDTSAEWSEEDEKMLTDISWAIRHCAYDDKKKERVMKWFNDDYRKSPRPQPKQEWSKNDTVFLNEITDFFENKTVRLQHDIEMYAHWLKSLPERFQSLAKANEEQNRLSVQAWAARDKDGYVHVFENKPDIGVHPNTWTGFRLGHTLLFDPIFPDLKYEDGPVKVELKFRIIRP